MFAECGPAIVEKILLIKKKKLEDCFLPKNLRVYLYLKCNIYYSFHKKD